MHEGPKPIPFWVHAAPPKKTNPEPYLDAQAATGTWRTFRNDRYPKAMRREQLRGHATLIDNRYKLHRLAKDRVELAVLVSLTAAQEQKPPARKGPEPRSRAEARRDRPTQPPQKSVVFKKTPQAIVFWFGGGFVGGSSAQGETSPTGRGLPDSQTGKDKGRIYDQSPVVSALFPSAVVLRGDSQAPAPPPPAGGTASGKGKKLRVRMKKKK
jgi:hypothetical protein